MWDRRNKGLLTQGSATVALQVALELMQRCEPRAQMGAVTQEQPPKLDFGPFAFLSRTAHPVGHIPPLPLLPCAALAAA